MSGNKKSKEKGDRSYKTGDIVLGKLRGFPPWPAQVVDPETVPNAVKAEQPSNKRATWYCVRFYPAGDYSWSLPKDLSLLQKHEIEAYVNEPHKKSNDLLAGYKVALDPTEWERELETKRAQADEEADDEEVDELEDGEDDGEEKPKPSKKRRRDSEAKPKAKRAPKEKSASGEKKRTPPAKKRAAKNGTKSKDVESEDDGAPATKKSKKAKEEVKDSRDSDPEYTKVKEWRHALQRAFLGKKTPTEQEMIEHDQVLTTIEEHNFTRDQLAYSKIGKVMRYIAEKDDGTVYIPKDDKHNIRTRAQALMGKWSAATKPQDGGDATLDSAAPSAVPNGTKADASEVNGTAATKEEDGEAAMDMADD